MPHRRDAVAQTVKLPWCVWCESRLQPRAVRTLVVTAIAVQGRHVLTKFVVLHRCCRATGRGLDVTPGSVSSILVFVEFGFR